MDFDRSVSEAHMKAYGWDMETFQMGNPFESHFVYLHDVDTGQVRLFSVLKAHLNHTPSPDGIPSQVLAYLLAECLLELRRGNLKVDHDPNFLPKLIGYIKCTQIFSLWQSKSNDRLHFLINVYHLNRGPEKAMLRPFAAHTDGIILTASEMMGLSKQVLQMDKNKHPEWFC